MHRIPALVQVALPQGRASVGDPTGRALKRTRPFAIRGKFVRLSGKSSPAWKLGLMRGFKIRVPVAAFVAICAVAVAGCASNSSGAGMIPGGQATAVSALGGVPAAAISGGASAQPSTAAPSTAALPLYGVLPVPSGTTPWTSNTGKLLSRVAFIQDFYEKSVWTTEENAFVSRGFVSAVYEGWINSDDSQQSIAILRFATTNGAQSHYNARTSTLQDAATKTELVNDPTDGGVGASDPTLDNLGNAHVEILSRVGVYVIDVIQYTPAKTDPASGKSLLEQQYQRLKSANLPGA